MRQRRRMYITVRRRNFIIISALYVIFFIAGVSWFYNIGVRYVASKLPADQVQNAITALQGEMVSRAIVAFVVSYGILAVIIFFISGEISKPIRVLAQYAENIKKGDYTRLEIPTRITRDEIDLFAEVFQQMVDQVRAREDALKQQITELQITIDEVKKQRQVEAIVESEEFSEIKQKAQEMKARYRKSTEAQE